MIFNRFNITIAVALVSLAGCGREDEVSLSNPPRTIEAASTAMERVFENEAPPAIQKNAAIIGEAMRTREFEKASAGILLMENTPGLTRQQGMAVMHSRYLLEENLARAMEQGDENARRAFELLRRSSGKQ